MKTFTESDDKGSAKLSVGQSFAIRLPVQMGTGYSWKVSQAPEGVKTVESKVEDNAGANGARKVGGSELQLFRFKAEKPGAGAVTLQYARPWEKDAPAAKTFTLNIEIKP